MSRKTSSRVSSNQARYLDYIAAHPGCSIAEVDRACRHNPQAGHKWVYDGVARLRRRGFVVAKACGREVHLYGRGAQKSAALRAMAAASGLDAGAPAEAHIDRIMESA